MTETLENIALCVKLLCYDEIAIVLSFLPHNLQQCCIHKNKKLKQRFLPINIDSFDRWNFHKETSQTVQDVNDAVNDLKQTCKKRESEEFFFRSSSIEFIKKMLMIGLTHKSLSSITDYIINFGNLYQSIINKYPDDEALKWMTHFSSIERLYVHNIDGYELLLVLFLCCMPRLKSVVFDLGFNQDEYKPNVFNSVVKNRFNDLIIDCVDSNGSKHFGLNDYDEYICVADFRTHYLPKQLRKRIDYDIISGAYQRNINATLECVKLCDEFKLSADSWIRLSGMFLLKPVYDAIIQKVNRGETKHKCKLKGGSLLISDDTFLDLIKTSAGIDTLIRLESDGVLIDDYKRQIREFDISFGDTCLLADHNIHICGYIKFMKQIDELENGGDEYDACVIERMKHKTLCHLTSHLDKGSIVSLLCLDSGDGVIRLLTEMFSTDETIKHHNTITRSIRKHNKQWYMITRHLCARGETFIMDCLLDICREHFKLILMKIYETEFFKTSVSFSCWLHERGIKKKENLSRYERNFVKRLRDPESCEQVPNKKQKVCCATDQ
jgi:hypothetical protein